MYPHGNHRPDRCCIRCHNIAVQYCPPWWPHDKIPYPSPTACYDKMDSEPKPYTGHSVIGSIAPGHDLGNPDRGVRRTLAARIQTAQNAGDVW